MSQLLSVRNRTKVESFRKTGWLSIISMAGLVQHSSRVIATVILQLLNYYNNNTHCHNCGQGRSSNQERCEASLLRDQTDATDQQPQHPACQDIGQPVHGQCHPGQAYGDGPGCRYQSIHGAKKYPDHDSNGQGACRMTGWKRKGIGTAVYGTPDTNWPTAAVDLFGKAGHGTGGSG